MREFLMRALRKSTYPHLPGGRERPSRRLGYIREETAKIRSMLEAGKISREQADEKLRELRDVYRKGSGFFA